MFTLKLFFMGLIAFVPGPGDRDLTVLLVDGRHGYTASDGTEIGRHYPFLLARAASCAGADCGPPDAGISEFFFSDKGSQAPGALASAVNGGVAWRLSESEIYFPGSAGGEGNAAAPLQLLRSVSSEEERGERRLPKNSAEGGDVSWIADLGKIYPSLGRIDPDVLAVRPIEGKVVARLHLTTGRVSVYRLADAGDQVVPVKFQSLLGSAESPYRQALADSVVVEIEMPGDSVEVRERAFGGAVRRSVRLKPEAGAVEIAILNTPAAHSAHGAPESAVPAPGKHFEMFYELAQTPPDKKLRPVPRVDSAAGVAWSTLYPPLRTPRSELLGALRLDGPRTAYERVLCPVGMIAAPAQ